MLSKGIPKSTIASYLVLMFSSTLILTLAFYNNGAANDDHIEVAELIFYQKKNPAPQDCWQCYHPKLYHNTIAQLGHLFKTKTREQRTIIAQGINAITGILTLLIFLTFTLQQKQFSKKTQLLAFSVVALNPRFIAINAQASNDAFIIFFSSVIIYSLYQLMTRLSIKYFSILLLASILAGVTKGNSFIIIAVVMFIFLVKILRTKKLNLPIKSYFYLLIMYLTISIFTIGYFGEYYDNYKKYGKPVVYNTPITDLPNLFHKTTFRRPGIRSIAEGYFTFRWFDLIQNPMISGSQLSYPKHHTSLWSHLYGRAHFVYFDNWPPGAWQSKDPRMMNVGRITLILGMIPTILFILGFFKEIKKGVQLFFKKNLQWLDAPNWIFSIFILAFLFFIILFTAKGRDFSFMKIIYLYPCILATLIPLLNGFEMANNYFQKNKSLFFIFQTLLLVLLVFYIIPILDLIVKLIYI